MKKAFAALLLVVAGCGGQSSPMPVADYGAPPAGVPLIYLGDPEHPGWYDGFDWTGKARGTIKLDAPPDQYRSLIQAPDGSAFLLKPFKALGGQYYDRFGRPIGQPFTAGARIAWGDDSRELCVLDGFRGAWSIGVTTPHGTSSTLHAVAIDPAIAKSGILAIDFAACSPGNDRAVLAYSFSGRPTQIYVVRISDGGILFERTYPANMLADITSSSDGVLYAENSNSSTGYLMDGAAPNTFVRRTADASAVATLDRTYGVLAFSSGDSVALVSTSPWASGVETHLALVRISDGKVLWSYDGREEYAGGWVQPNGSDMAVMLQSPYDQSPHASVSVVILQADGKSTAIPGKYVRA